MPAREVASQSSFSSNADSFNRSDDIEKAKNDANRDAARKALEGGQKAPKKPFAFYMSFAALMMLAYITSWDATSLSIALPTITDILKGDSIQAFWASISFILGVAITQPIYVSISDVIGRKPPLYASLFLFALGSIIFAVAQNMITLIFGRLIQGFGAGGLDVLEEIILADITSLKERPMYLGLVAMAIAAGSITGPILGAVFSEYVDWRWIAWINLPIVGIATVLCLFFLHLKPIEMGLREKIRRLDWFGMILYTIGATATALPLSWADSLYSWGSWRTILPLVIGILVLGVFWYYERFPSEAIIPYRIFANRTAAFSIVTSAVHGLLLYMALLYLPLFFEAVFLESPLGAGVSTLPVCVLVVAFSIISPIAVEFTRNYCWQLWFGWIFTAVFMGLWITVDQYTSKAVAYTYQALLGVGFGTIYTATQIPMQASVVDVDDTGLAVGMLVCFRIFGALIGLSAGATTFNAEFENAIKKLYPLPAAMSELSDSKQAIGFIPKMRSLKGEVSNSELEALIDAYRKPFRTIFIIMTVFACVGFVASLFIKELPLDREDVGKQGFQQPIPGMQGMESVPIDVSRPDSYAQGGPSTRASRQRPQSFGLRPLSLHIERPMSFSALGMRPLSQFERPPSVVTQQLHGYQRPLSYMSARSYVEYQP